MTTLVNDCPVDTRHRFNVSKTSIRYFINVLLTLEPRRVFTSRICWRVRSFSIVERKKTDSALTSTTGKFFFIKKDHLKSGKTTKNRCCILNFLKVKEYCFIIQRSVITDCIKYFA